MSDSSGIYAGDVLRPEAPQGLTDLLLGPMQVGYQVQFFGFGIFFTLFAVYAATGELRRHQRIGQLVLVASLVLNFVYTSFVFYESYITAISQDRGSFALQNGDVAWNALPMLIASITALTEGYLTARAGLLILSRLVRILFFVWMGCLIALVIIGGAVTTADGVFYYNGAQPGDLAISYSAGTAMYFWGSAVADVSISIACACSLRSRIAGFNSRTDSLLRHLIVLAFRTALYTAVVSLVSAVVSSVYRDSDVRSFVVYSFWLFMPAAYGLSLFTFSVSSKRAIDQRLGSSVSPGYVPAQGPKRHHAATSPPPETPIALNNMRGAQLQPGGQIPLQIRVQHEEVVSVDEGDDVRDSKSGIGRQRDWEV
ncbi:hypothetical protein NBRC10512_000632 [Rhodotorula toruloides]|uniref:RHTO0S01e05446g1_1 n=2 Tax=Rhodotorula toruloides TaxID=5286 RepID=A0A061ADR9_RHOTO|nr:uncharacterized protein RHTO_01445 [Rhodotorula toruloides NP11]EMS21798.1 hypothetical protein RHTO_01445 [Rhodotorula toruloides NP11]CDR35712.1 RHTO0S01e05446g1_1 [Rhodotorula toruloides]